MMQLSGLVRRDLAIGMSEMLGGGRIVLVLQVERVWSCGSAGDLMLEPGLSLRARYASLDDDMLRTCSNQPGTRHCSVQRLLKPADLSRYHRCAVESMRLAV